MFGKHSSNNCFAGNNGSCHNACSVVGRSDKNLAERAGTGDWQKGKRFGAGASEDSIRSWIEGLN